MKVILLKKSFFIFLLILLISVIITIIATHQVVKIQYEPNILDEDEICEEPDEATSKEEMLIEKYNDKKLAVLTFDDGPSKYTDELIDNLKKRNVPVTFFILGDNAKKRLDTLKFASDAGNEIAIHSYVHKLFTKLKNDEIMEQVDMTKKLIFDTIQKDVTLIRVPYGTTNKRVNFILDNMHLTNVLWTVDSKDWKFKNVEKTYTYVMKKFKGNDIILMHDSFKSSVDAAIQIVDKLQSECYVFVTVSEFYKIKNLASKN